MSSLLCLGRHTITGMLATSGSLFHDWAAAYRLFSQQRVPIDAIFSVVRRSITADLPPGAPLRAFLDDSILRRSGLHTPGVAWRRDPLGPRFQTNFVRGQRFLQVSAAMTAPNGSYRLAPIAFVHAPTAVKPKPNATEQQRTQYRADARNARISSCAAQQVIQLRSALDQDPQGLLRPLVLGFDGGFTNSTMLKSLPPRTVAIGRIRKDAALHWSPDPALRKAKGRRLCYGALAPTPDQLRIAEDQPWETMTLRHSGMTHTLRFKRLPNVMWRAAGAHQTLQLIVIAPLAYRLRKGSKLLYRDPAYLICTDPAMAAIEIIDTYFQRWDIEVNFRDEKTLLGVGQAQVRNAASVEAAPAFGVAAYSLLLVAGERAFRTSSVGLLPQPKWAASSQGPRTSTQQLIHQLRAEVWGRGLGLDNFSGFVSHLPPNTKPEKYSFNLASAVCYANG